MQLLYSLYSYLFDDWIGPQVLKIVQVPYISHYIIFLEHVCNTSVFLGSAPPTSLSPSTKSGDKSCIKNYRPISLLSNISKVLERIVYDKVIHHVSSAISPRQFEGLQGRSTLQQLLAIYNIS